MISLRSFFNFVCINLFFVGYGYIDYMATLCFSKTWNPFSLLPLFLISLFRNSFLYALLEYNTRSYEMINLGMRNGKSNENQSEILPFFQISLMDAIFLYFLFYQNDISPHYTRDAVFFIPKSFVFEIIFDLFHYIAHRIEHKVPFLYHHFHKYHHTHTHPTFITTYHHHIGDLILSNVIPFYLSYYLCSRVFDISPYMISMLYISKIYIELCGHSGKDIRKVGSFVQCIWIPQLLGISLYTIDHDNHHRWNHFNYGKRFSLWDRVFGTYKETL